MDSLPTPLRLRGKKRPSDRTGRLPTEKPVKSPRKGNFTMGRSLDNRFDGETRARKEKNKKKYAVPVERAPLEIIEQILSYNGPSVSLYEASPYLAWRMSEDIAYKSLFHKVFYDLREPISEEIVEAAYPPPSPEEEETDNATLHIQLHNFFANQPQPQPPPPMPVNGPLFQPPHPPPPPAPHHTLLAPPLLHPAAAPIPAIDPAHQPSFTATSAAGGSPTDAAQLHLSPLVAAAAAHVVDPQTQTALTNAYLLNLHLFSMPHNARILNAVGNNQDLAVLIHHGAIPPPPNLQNVLAGQATDQITALLAHLAQSGNLTAHNSYIAHDDNNDDSDDHTNLAGGGMRATKASAEDEADEKIPTLSRYDALLWRSKLLAYKWMTYERFQEFSKSKFSVMIKEYHKKTDQLNAEKIAAMSIEEKKDYRAKQEQELEKEIARLRMDLKGVRIPVKLFRATTMSSGLMNQVKLLALLVDGGAFIEVAHSLDGEEAESFFRYGVAHRHWIIVATLLKYRSKQPLNADPIFSHEVFTLALMDTLCDPFFVKMCFLLAEDSVPLICDQHPKIRTLMRTSIQTKRHKWQHAFVDYLQDADDDTVQLIIWAMTQKTGQSVDMAELDRRTMRYVDRTMRS